MKVQKTRWEIALVVCMFVMALGAGARARANELAELKEQVKLLQQRIEQLEAKQNQQSELMEKEIAKAVEEKEIGALPASIKWVENVKISGDLRYRHESIDSESSGKRDQGRHRHRIRARLGLEGKINDEWDVGFRIASGSSDPSSTNQSLDNGFSSKDLWLDLAYFNWHPVAIEGLNAYGGKMKNPFYKVGKNQLIWDSDLNPEGIAAKYVMPFGEHDKLYINGGGFWAEESGSGIDQSLWGAQTYLKHNFENKDYLVAGASYFDYGNTKGQATIYDSTDSYGNSVDSSGRYANDYDIVEGFVEYGFKVADRPMAVFGNYIQNVASTASEDTGWLIGCKLNKAKKPGSWELSYNYRDLEADAVIGVFSDSDFIGGGTNGKGHQFGLKYQLAKNLQAALTYFLNERGSNDDDYKRLQADLIFKF